MITTDDVAITQSDVRTPYEENNKVIITNDYGLLDRSFIEDYATNVGGVEDSFVLTNSNGKIDNSFLNSTNANTPNSVVVTNSSGKINYNMLNASTTPTASYIPIANNSGKLNNNWLNTVVTTTGTADKSKFVITNNSGKVDTSLLNASSTPAASTLILSDNTGKIDDSWIKTSSTSTPNTIVKLDSSGKLDANMIKSGLFIPMTGGEPTGTILIQSGTNYAAGDSLATLKAALPNFCGFGSNTYSDGFIIGMNGSTNADNYLLIATHDDGNEPIIFRQYGGASRFSSINSVTPHEVTLMDKDGYTTLLQLTSNGNITSTNGGLSVKNNITT